MNVNFVLTGTYQKESEHRCLKKNLLISEKIDLCKITLIRDFDLHSKTTKENPRLFEQIKIAQKSAEILISKEGTFNSFLVETVINEFHLYFKPLNRQRIRAVDHLRWIKDSSQAQHLLKKIGTSKKIHKKAAHIIKAAMGLNDNTTLRAYHAAMTALSALLSPFYQRSIGNCFAFGYACNLLENNPLQCLKDFYLLLKKGVLRGAHNKIEHEIPLRLSFPPSDHVKIALSTYCDGTLHFEDDPFQKNSMVNIEQVSELKSVALSLGVENIPSAFRFMVSNLVKNESFYQAETFKINEMVDLLVKFRSKKEFYDFYSVKKLKKLALLGYESNFRHPLLEAWALAFSALPESGTESRYRLKIIRCLTSCLKSHFQTKSIKLQQSWDSISLSFYNYLSKSLYYRYDPSVSTEIQEDNSSYQGAFILYTYSVCVWMGISKRADSPSSFQNLIRNLYYGFLADIPETELLDIDLDIDLVLKNYLVSDAFLIDILMLYAEGDEKKHINTCKFNLIPATPWRISNGHAMYSVMHSYVGKRPSIFTLSFNSKETLCKSIFELSQKMSCLPVEEFQKISLPLVIPDVHSCNLKFKDLKFLEAYSNNISSEDWLQKIMEIGKKVSESYLDEDKVKNLIHFINTELLDPEKIPLFSKTALHASVLPLSLMCKCMMDQMVIYGMKKGVLFSKARKRIDDYVVKFLLNKKQKESIIDTVIPFANSNWEWKNNEIDMAFLFNPANEQLEIWKIDENKEFIGSFSEKWFEKFDWQVYVEKK